MTIDATTVLVSLLSSIGGGGIVAWVNHWLTLRRESSKREDDLKIQRRIDAWKSLEKAARIDSTGYDQTTADKLGPVDK